MESPIKTEIDLSNHQQENAQAVDLNSTPLIPRAMPADEWDPFLEMQRMREEMDQMFGDALGRFGPNISLNQVLGEPPAFSPKLKINESRDEYTLEVDISEMGNPEINTKLTGQTLSKQSGALRLVQLS